MTVDVENLYENYSSALFAFLEYRTGDRVLAEDLVADTFERVLRSRRLFNPRRGSEKQWIYSIALNLVRDHARRAAVEQRVTQQVAVESPSVPGEREPDAVHDRDELRSALERLTQDERDVIALRFGADLTLKEVARVLKQGESAVEGRLYRGLGKLREQLQ